MRRQPEARFTFWGPLPLSGPEPALKALIDHPATRFLGLTRPERILDEASTVDVWLLPFRLEKLQGAPLNSHKVLEYLATGRAVVMNWLEAYDGNQLVHLARRDGSSALPNLLDDVLSRLDTVNAPEMMARRRAYALGHSYSRHFDRISALAGLDTLMRRRDAA